MRRTQHPASCLRLDPVRKHDLKISGGSENFETGGAEDNLSDPSSFIANSHNEIYAFYTEKAAF